MPNKNTFPGYVKVPGKELYPHDIRFDFNFQIDSEPGNTKLNRFNLRLFTLPEKFNEEHPEIAVSLTAEQWLDLIESMRAEIDLADTTRKKFDDIDKQEDGW